MYINPVAFGVLCTIGLEIVGLFAYALITTYKRGKK